MVNICNVMLVMCNVIFLLNLKTTFQGKEKQDLKTQKKKKKGFFLGVKFCHLVMVKMDMQRAKRLFLDKIAQILPNFDLKNINSTCTQRIFHEKKGSNSPDFLRIFFFQIARFLR